MRQVFFFDTDSLIFREPWSVDLSLPDGPYQLRYQTEHEVARGCAATVNSGQIYMTRTNGTAAYFAHMRARKAEIIGGQHALDQAYMAGAADAAGYKRCALDASLFIGHCGQSRLLAASAADVVVFHVNCVPGAINKLRILLHFFKSIESEVEHSRNLTIGDIDG